MAYAEQLGFRASTCSPHSFYDLETDTATDLTLVPSAIMDSTLKDYLLLSPEEAMQACRSLIGTIKQVQGNCVSIWHNHSITDEAEWEGWQSVFLDMLEAAH